MEPNRSLHSVILFIVTCILEKKDFKEGETVTVLVGPEGDFSPAERELILNGSNTIAFSLSKNILRTDTAVISAISLVNFITNQN